MKKSTESKKDIWAEGKYFDLWSLNHFLFGVLAGMIALAFSISFSTGFLATLILAVFWEIFEKVYKVSDSYWRNTAGDVIFALVGFVVVYLLLRGLSLSGQVWFLVVVVTFIVFIVLNFLGWLAFLKRK